MLYTDWVGLRYRYAPTGKHGRTLISPAFKKKQLPFLIIRGDQCASLATREERDSARKKRVIYD